LETQNPKCVNCGEGHPANYRGCIVAKELQKIKNKKATCIRTNAGRQHRTKHIERLNKARRAANVKDCAVIAKLFEKILEYYWFVKVRKKNHGFVDVQFHICTSQLHICMNRQ
jgi:hypothetical protein